DKQHRDSARTVIGHGRLAPAHGWWVFRVLQRPIHPVPFPCLITTSSAKKKAKKKNHPACLVIRHRRMIEGWRAGNWSALYPGRSIVFPCRSIIAEEHRYMPGTVVGHRLIGLCGRTVCRAVKCPAFSIPFPGLVRCVHAVIRLSNEPTEHDGLLARVV